MKSYLEKVNQFLLSEPDPAFARRAGIILENLDLSAGQMVLDAGCGRGFYVKVLDKLGLRLKIFGVDLNEKYLKVGRQICGSAVHLLRADIVALPFESRSFDRIIASEILEHIPDDNKALAELFRVLKPGGKMLLSVPNRKYPFFWDPFNWVLERLFKTHVPPDIWWLAGIWADHRRLYPAKELETKLKKAGFSIKKEWEATFYCFPFSHFLFYALGKNLVEMGFFAGCNRFSDHPRSFAGQVLLWPVRAVDKLNHGQKGKRSVNLIMEVGK